MKTIPFTDFINRYSEISKKCRQSGEPICLTKDGKNDLVIMSIDAYEKKEELLKLKERLLDIEFEQRNGAKYYSIEELDSALKRILSK